MMAFPRIGVGFLLILFIATMAWAQTPPTTTLRPSTRPRWFRQPPPPPKAFFVAPSGDDTHAGTEMQPFKTIQKAMDEAHATDTVTVLAGTYKERITLHNSGALFRAPITLQAAPGAEVIIDGSDVPQGRAVIDTNMQEYVTIKGLTLLGGFRGPGVYAVGGWKISIENCHIMNTGDSGVKVDKSGHVVVTGNHLEHICQRPTGNDTYAPSGEESISIKRSQYVEVSGNHIHESGKEGIDVKEGSNHVEVFGNLIHNTRAQGLYADAWDQPTGDIRFYNNVVHDCGFGIVAGAETGGLLHDVWFFNNVVYHNAGPGMIVEDYSGPPHRHPMKNIYFINNTVVDHKNGGASGGWHGGMNFENADAENVVVRNNILWDCGPDVIWIINGKKPISATVDHNVVDGGHQDLGKAGNLVVQDPMFVDPAHGDFRLKPGSPAIGAGSPDLAPPVDFGNQPRNAERPTVGAFQG